MVQKLANWLTAREQRADAPAIPAFVMTETAKQIVADADLRPDDPRASSSTTAPLAWARPPPLRCFQRNNNNVWMVTASPTRST